MYVRKIKNFIHLLSSCYWTWRCGWPGKKLYLIGITGTDGKTTTSTLIYEILKKAGFKVGLFSTVYVKYFVDKEVVFGKGLHTTNPDPSQLQPLLKQMKDAGVTHVVMEVTSHGLDQNRVWGCDFQIGVWTNLTHEHIDYHKNMQNYRDAKIKLFKNTKYAVLNGDDPSFAYFKSKILSSKPQTIIKYQKSKIYKINSSLAGDYNKYNIAVAEAVAEILKVGKFVAPVVRSFSGVPGRREEVKNNKGFKVYVDFAHTPNALLQVLQVLQAEKTKQAKLIVVFGCTGERDKEKRPMMGEIAVRIADVAIITSDDVRGENQDEIARQILVGIPVSKMKKVQVESDRKKALEMAFNIARPGDIVLLAGKGHEKSILIGKNEQPWSDVEQAGKILGTNAKGENKN